jgi:hypothetical protein
MTNHLPAADFARLYDALSADDEVTPGQLVAMLAVASQLDGIDRSILDRDVPQAEMPTNDYLAALAKMGRSTFIGHANRLEAMGYLTRMPRGKNPQTGRDLPNDWTLGPELALTKVQNLDAEEQGPESGRVYMDMSTPLSDVENEKGEYEYENGISRDPGPESGPCSSDHWIYSHRPAYVLDGEEELRASRRAQERAAKAALGMPT